MERKQVRLDQIIADTSLQVRKEINYWYVSKFVQVLKSGNDFQDSIVVLPDMRIVSGFTRYEAYKKVLDPSTEITVRVYHAKDDADAFQFAVKENITHGQPLEEFEKKSIRRKLQEQGWTDEQIGQFIGVSVDRFKKWDAERVIVYEGKQQQQMDTKPGTRIPKKVSQSQYDQHVKHHAVSTIFHAHKIIGRIKDDTIEEDNQTWEVLQELNSLLDELLEKRKAV